MQDGLRVLSDSLSCQVVENPGTGGVAEVRWPWICLGSCPSGAWLLSGDTGWGRDADSDWDLWEVVLGDQDEVHVRPSWGAEVEEVRVHNSIPADRLWYCGRRLNLVEENPA